VTISFKTKDNKGVIFANNGNFVTTGDCINIDDIFEVVIEEEITEDTEFYGIQEVYLDIDEQEIIVENLLEKQTIRDVLNNHDGSYKRLQIYEEINEKRELSWEADNDKTILRNKHINNGRSIRLNQNSE